MMNDLFNWFFIGSSTGGSVTSELCCEVILLLYIPRANGAKRRSGRKPGARVTNSALAFTYIRIMRCYIAQWHSEIKSRPIRHFLCHGRW